MPAPAFFMPIGTRAFSGSLCRQRQRQAVAHPQQTTNKQMMFVSRLSASLFPLFLWPVEPPSSLLPGHNFFLSLSQVGPLCSPSQLPLVSAMHGILIPCPACVAAACTNPRRTGAAGTTRLPAPVPVLHAVARAHRLLSAQLSPVKHTTDCCPGREEGKPQADAARMDRRPDGPENKHSFVATIDQQS